MAAVQITSANTNNITNGDRNVVRTSSGTLYAVIFDDTDDGIEVWKSTDGSSWTEKDATNNPAGTDFGSPACAIDTSDVIHIVYRDGNGFHIYYATFATSSDTFTL